MDVKRRAGKVAWYGETHQEVGGREFNFSRIEVNANLEESSGGIQTSSIALTSMDLDGVMGNQAIAALTNAWASVWMCLRWASPLKDSA